MRRQTTWPAAEELSVTTHGCAREIDVARHDDGGSRQAMLDYYSVRYGKGAEAIFDSPGVAYARIEAERTFTFHLPAELASGG